MMKHVLMLGAAAAIIVSAVVANLFALDIITSGDSWRALGRTLLVIGINTAAVLLLIVAARLVLRPRSQ